MTVRGHGAQAGVPAPRAMKQVVQRPRDGVVRVVEAPPPEVRPGWVLVANRYSLISAGTERSKVELGGKSLLEKARARPDLVRKLAARARAEGVKAALQVARDRLDALAPLGYSCAGVVRAVGPGVEGLVPGDRVACGGGWAAHAELVAVPRTLAVKVPDGVPLDAAAYATVGAIALHGVRRAESVVGERVGVIGLGLVGQLAVRILLASGCRPVGVDLDPAAVELARAAGADALLRDDPAVAAVEGTLDAVLVCAAARSADPVHLAAELARDRGRIVVVGDVPVEADRALMYEKELELRLSRSYGPGRYDRDYEEHARDLPAGYVRWTEQRNLEAFLDLVAAGALDPAPLTTHRFPVARAGEAYAALSGGDGRAFGILLEYDPERADARPAAPAARPRSVRAGAPRIGLVGAGAFARATLLPALAAAGAELTAVASESGLAAADTAERFGFERAATAEEILAADDVDALVVATRHDSHARLAAAALRAGKPVLVEKPLALTAEELEDVRDALASGAPLMVGFNRRFAPHALRLREALGDASGATLLARVNAGPLPTDHWLHDPEVGGGRLVGEGCHFVDLLAFLAGSMPVSAHASASPQRGRPLESSDSFAAVLRFANGAVGTVVYSGNGDPSLPKERVEAFSGGLAAVLDDFRRLELRRGGKRTVEQGRQDKGHRAQVARFVEVAAARAEPPAAETYLASSAATLALVESLRTGRAVELS